MDGGGGGGDEGEGRGPRVQGQTSKTWGGACRMKGRLRRTPATLGARQVGPLSTNCRSRCWIGLQAGVTMNLQGGDGVGGRGGGLNLTEGQAPIHLRDVVLQLPIEYS